MDVSFFSFFDWITWFYSILLLVCSVIFCWKARAAPILRTFPLFCFVNVVSDTWVLVRHPSMPVVSMLYTLFELLYFAFLFTGFLRRPYLKGVLWVLVAIEIAYTLGYWVRYGKVPLGFPEEAEAMILLSAGMVSYTQFFTHIQGPNIQKEPAFWLITGVLFYFILFLPAELFSQYFNSMGRPDLGRQFFGLNNIALIGSYSLYVKAILCPITK